MIREGKYGEGMACYQKARASAAGDLGERLRQKMLVEEGRHFLEQGKRERAMKKLREALRLPDEEFQEEARRLSGHGGLVN